MNSELCTVYFSICFTPQKNKQKKKNVNLFFKMLSFLCWKYNRTPHGQAFKQISSPLSELYFMLHNRSHHPERSDPGDVRPCCTLFLSALLMPWTPAQSSFSSINYIFISWCFWGQTQCLLVNKGQRLPFNYAVSKVEIMDWYWVGVFVEKEFYVYVASFVCVFMPMLVKHV